MKKLGIWQGEVAKPMKPIISKKSDEVQFINAAMAGIFLPSVKHCTNVKKGDEIGKIVDPLASSVLDTLISPCDGFVFTIREYPVVDEGSLIARILMNERSGGTK